MQAALQQAQDEVSRVKTALRLKRAEEASAGAAAAEGARLKAQQAAKAQAKPRRAVQRSWLLRACAVMAVGFDLQCCGCRLAVL